MYSRAIATPALYLSGSEVIVWWPFHLDSPIKRAFCTEPFGVARFRQHQMERGVQKQIGYGSTTR
jgi:hypothetical protein